MKCACTEHEGAITSLCMAHHWAFCGNLMAELGELHLMLKVFVERALTDEEADRAADALREWVVTWTPEKVGDATSRLWRSKPEEASGD